MPPSLQGYLEERVVDGAGWSWSALRPNPVCGFRWRAMGARAPRGAIVAASRSLHVRPGPGPGQDAVDGRALRLPHDCKSPDVSSALPL